MKTIFISGHLDLTETEFKDHYIPKLLEFINLNFSFVVGDARGCDSMTQLFLKEKKCDCTVFHMFESPRNNAGFKTVDGFKSDEERDLAMHNRSQTTLAWVRPGREKSGTAKNLKRPRD